MTQNYNPTNEQLQRGFRVFYAARRTIQRYAQGGNLLIIVTLLAMIVANIPAINSYYFEFWTKEVHLQIGNFNLFSHGGEPMNLLQFINDALMAIFFFTIGLEIKREVLVGELSSIRQALLPIIAACGGMIVPVIIFSFLSQGTDYAHGSAIPMATDIAFSLGVLSMLGKRVPLSLKIFLTTLAVVDDLGGIIVIAAFYTTHINVTLLLIALGLIVVLALGGVMQIQSKAFYFGLGGVVWYLFLNSGIHPTIAGVIVAFCVPAKPVFAPDKYIKMMRNAMKHLRTADDDCSSRTILNKERLNWLKQIESASDKVISPLQDLEDTLHPLVNYLIIPLFAFANAGILLLGLDPLTAVQGVSLAVICGLVVGKFVGIFLFSWLTIVLRIAPMPALSSWNMMGAISMLGGIGFTVSLFIATLSFSSVDLLNHAKLGIVIGSLLAGILAFMWLSVALPKAPADDEIYD